MKHRITSLILSSIALFAINNLSRSNAQETETLQPSQAPSIVRSTDESRDETKPIDNDPKEQVEKNSKNELNTQTIPPQSQLNMTEGESFAPKPYGIEREIPGDADGNFLASAVNYAKEESLGLIALITAVISLIKSIRTANSTEKAVRKLERVVKNQAPKGNNTSTQNINNIESDLNNARIENLTSRLEVLETKSKYISVTPTTAAPLPKTTRQVQAPTTIDKPKKPTKEELIAALNIGDRQQLRDASKCQLNITSWSENEIIMGKSTTTELEEVMAGGSYLLVIINNEHWLFPTEQTLKGFTAAQRAKGIFEYEEQVISSPQLIEPALLEQSGSNWKVKQLGKILKPKI